MASKEHDMPSVVHLDVGGTVFATAVDTLTLRETDSMLAVMFSGRHRVHKDPKKGTVFIDRDGTHFRHVLNWLRDGVVPLLDATAYRELLREAQFYQLTGLIGALTVFVTKKEEYYEDKIEMTRREVMSFSPSASAADKFIGGIFESSSRFRGAIEEVLRNTPQPPTYTAQGKSAGLFKKRLASFGGNPTLLIEGLPKKVAEASNTTLEFLKWEQEEPSTIAVIHGPTGSGKTRLALELLTTHMGLYITREAIGTISEDVKWLLYTLGNLLHRGDERAEFTKFDRGKNRKQAVMGCLCLITSRLLALCAYVDACIEAGCSPEPGLWLQMQLCTHSWGVDYMLMSTKQLYFLRPYVEDLHIAILVLTEKIRKLFLNCYIVVDGAVGFMTTYENHFSSSLIPEKGRGFLSPLLQATAQLPWKIVALATSISVVTHMDYFESQMELAKSAQNFVAPIFARLDGWKDVEHAQRYVREFVDISHSDLQYWYEKFAGRFRPIIRCIEVLAVDSTPIKAADQVWFEITQKGAKYKGGGVLKSLYDKLAYLVQQNFKAMDLDGNVRTQVLNFNNLLPYLAIRHKFFGGEWVFIDYDAMEMVNWGFALVENCKSSSTGLRGTLKEKYAYEAIWNFFNDTSPGGIVANLTKEMALYQDLEVWQAMVNG